MLLLLIQCCRGSHVKWKRPFRSNAQQRLHEIYKDSPCLGFSQEEEVRKMENINDPSLAGMLHMDSPEETEASNRARPGRKCPFPMKLPFIGILIIILILFTILISILITYHVRGGQKSEQSSPVEHPCVPDSPACPSAWVGYERKCYFFSEEERNWTSCQSFCAFNNSSLAAINNILEKKFILRYKGTAGHWIGLKKDLNHTWKWVDGTELNNILEVKGVGGDCAFLSSSYAISSQCHVPRHWICSQPDKYTRNMSCQISA